MQLEAIKAERGEAKEQVLPDKPLAQVLADTFQAQWKQMKPGAADGDRRCTLRGVQQPAVALLGPACLLLLNGWKQMRRVLAAQLRCLAQWKQTHCCRTHD